MANRIRANVDRRSPGEQQASAYGSRQLGQAIGIRVQSEAACVSSIELSEYNFLRSSLRSVIMRAMEQRLDKTRPADLNVGADPRCDAGPKAKIAGSRQRVFGLDALYGVRSRQLSVDRRQLACETRKPGIVSAGQVPAVGPTFGSQLALTA
jgi:hypothetical protein